MRRCTLPLPGVDAEAPVGRSSRRLLLLLTAVVVAAVTAGTVLAYFTATVAAGSNGAAKAAGVNQGATPTATVSTSVGREVTVSWGASTLTNGHAVDGYAVQRYPAAGGLPTTGPYGTCSVTVTGTSCVEDLVPPGQWRYTVTPVFATNWRGAESAQSGIVTLTQAIAVSGSPYGAAKFTPTASGAPGSIAGFGPNEGVSYRLDSSTSLAGSPSSVATNGNASITALAIPNAGDGAHTVWALGNAASPSQASTAIVIDTTPPTVNATLSPAPNGAGWNNTSPVQVTLAANDGSGSGINQIKYTTDGSDPTTSGTALVYSAPFNRSSTTTVKFFATDNAGNASAVQTQAVNIDTVPPTNSVSANVQSGNALLAGTTLWYRGVNAGSFTLSNALTDSGGSGTASTSYAALAGSSGGWTFTPSSVTSGPPYVSNTFSWSGGTSSAPTETVTGYDVASNFASTTLNLTNDSNGPAGGSVDATGLVGTGGRYSNSTSLSIAFSAGTDAGVGIASSGFQLLRASAPLSSGNGTSDGSCGSYGSYTQVGSNDPVSPVADTVSDHTCYRYEYVVADKLGNSTTYTSPDIKIDTTGPSAPAVTLSSASGNTYISGSTVYTNPQAGKSGGFTVGATTSDSDSGIQKVNFPALTGYSAGGGDVTSSPYSTTYSWSGSGATASGSKTVTAYDNAALTATGSFTVTPDTTNPTISASAKKADNTTYTAGTWTNQTVTVHYTCSDAGSGIASCPADQVYSADGTQTASGTATDNVGNSGSATFGLVEIDKTNPTISASAKNADNSTYTAGTWTNQTVTVHYTCSDALSGIASCPADQVFSAEGTTASTSGTATDNAGNSASASFGPIKIDKTVPANSISLLSQSTQAGPAGTTNAMSYLTGSTVYFDGGAAGSFQIRNAVSDALSGPASSAFGALGGTTGGWTFTSSTVTTPSGGPYVSNAFNWAASAAGSPTETVTGADAAGNTTATVLTFTNDQTAPTTPVVSFPAASGNYTNSSWNASGGGCATSTICGTASDTGSGIGKVQVSVQATSGTSSGKYWNGSDFSSATEVLLNAAGTTSWSLAFPAANFTDANYTVNVYAIDNVGNFASKSASFLIDNVAPTSSVASITPSPNGAGWEKANTTVALQASDSVSGVATIFWSESGAQTASGSNAGGSSFNTPAITAEGTTTLTYHAVDNAGNVEANNTYVVKLDKTAPTNSLSLVNGSGGGSYLSGSTVYYRGSVAGQFQLQDAVADGLSGPASSAFAALGGTSTGWSFTSSTVSSPSGGPYVSNVFSWTGGTSSAPTEVATGSDVAGNTTAAGSLTFTNDSTAPSTTAALSPAANGSGWNNTSPVQVTLTPTDAGSGVSRTKYTTDGTDPSTSGTAVVYSAPFNVSSTTTVKYYSTDRVGNAESTRTQQVNIDTQPPNAPTMTSLPYAIKNGQSLSVTSASDNGASGIASVTYLFCSGTGCSPSTSIGSSSTGPGYAVTWNSQPADGTYTVAAKATDAAGNVSSLGATQQVTVENSVASTGIAISNHTGGTAGKPEAGDTITITYSGPLAVNTLCGNWSGDASSHSVTDASVTITDKGTQGTHDAILSTGVSSSTCGTVHFGTLDLSGANYVTSTVTFSGSTLSWNASSYTLTLTLGTPSNSAALGTDTTTRKPTYSADASITGSSGIAITTTTFTAPAYAVLF